MPQSASTPGTKIRMSLPPVTAVTALSSRLRSGGDRAPERLSGPLPGSFLVRSALVGFVASSVVVVGATFGGTEFVSRMPGAWFFGSAGGIFGSVGANSKHAPALAIIAVYGGLALLACAWLQLMRALRRQPGVPVGQVVAVIAVWALPVLLAPPLFSQDVYSYAGQGELVSHHINPYAYGTGVLGATPFNLQAGPTWANNPSPYGPLFLGLAGLATVVSGHHLLADVVLLRLLALLGLGLLVAGLPTLARWCHRDPAEVMVLGAGSPIVVMALVGGAHNDALMIGLLVAGLAVARRYGPMPGIVLCSLAAAVKVPALLGVVFIGWNWPGRLAPTKDRVLRTAAALGMAVVTLAAVSFVTGVGWGWIKTIKGTASVVTGVTPVYTVAHILALPGDLVGIHISLSALRAVTTTLGLLAAAVIVVWLLRRSPEMGMIKSLGLALLAAALLSPVLWSWYLTWGLVVTAAAASGRVRRAIVFLTAVETFIMPGSVKRLVNGLGALGGLQILAIVLAIAAIVLVFRRLDPTLWPRAGRLVDPAYEEDLDGQLAAGGGMLEGALPAGELRVADLVSPPSTETGLRPAGPLPG